MPGIPNIRDLARRPFTGPAVWRGPDLAGREDWVLRLSPRRIGELRTALRTARGRGTPLLRMTIADFPLPTLADELAGAAAELATGRGFVLVKGIGVGELSDRDAGTVLRGICQYLGRPVPQDAEGRTLCHVRDAAAAAAGPAVSVLRSRAGVPFHTDEADLLGLLCLRPARSGGDTSLVSSAALHNAVVDRRPDLAERLYRTHFFDRRDAHAPGEPPYAAAPLATTYGAELSLRYDRGRLEAARDLAGVPGPEQADTELYDLVDALARSSRLRLDLRLEAGDLLLVDNHAVLHARSAFEDVGPPGRGRHLLRMWLARRGDTGPPGAGARGPRALEIRRGVTPLDIVRPRNLRPARPAGPCEDRRRHRADG
ncbi:TauD/TfdA family dioxygenase [Streptomyces sp. NPDC005803]|uniref:TauD/TfdA family dioxygenase n=1 Tax=Streptomyces sp. NPDC005803 TaxID=3154297 RepID=UPI0033DD4490